MEGAPWNVRNVPGTCICLTLRIRYIIGTSLLAYKDQETKSEVGSGDRHLPLSCLVDRVLGGE